MKKSMLFTVSAIVAVAFILFWQLKKPSPDQNPEESEPQTFTNTTDRATAPEALPAEPDANLVKLELELPKPLFSGTPKTIKTPNLERKPSVTEVMVPVGTQNISFEKTVTSSDDFPVIGELEYCTDGDKDGADGSYVELGPSVQWVQIDLGDAKSIYAIAFWHYHSQARAYRDVIVQVADNAEFTENIQTVFNNDHDNSAGLGIGSDKEYIETNKGKLVDAKGVKGQFVRLYSGGSTSSDMNHYIEVEVYGK